MAERPQSGDFLSIHARPRFTPAAAPVDTYARPAEPVQSRGAALVQALSSLDEAFSPTLDREIKRAAEMETAEGQELFEKNRKDFATAVREGLIPHGASPFVRRGYRKSQLHVAGANYAIELSRALDDSGLERTSDPQAVESFIADFNRGYEERNGISAMPTKDVAEFYRPMVVRANDSFRNEWATRNITYTSTQRVKSTEDEIKTAISLSKIEGPPPVVHAALSEFTGWLGNKAKELYEEGLDSETISNSIISTVTDAATKAGSIALVGSLGLVKVAGDVSLAQTDAGRGAIKATRYAIALQEQAAHEQAEREILAVSAMEQDELEARIYSGIQAGEDVDTFLSALGRIDPNKARVWDNYRDAEGKDRATAYGDKAFAGVRQLISEATSEAEARNIVDEAFLYYDLPFDRRGELMAYAKDRFGESPGADTLTRIEKDRSFTSALSSLNNVLNKPPYPGAAEEYATRTEVAKAEMTDAAVLWMQQNSDEDGNYDRLAFRQFLLDQQVAITRLHKNAEPAQEVPDWATE